MYRMLCTPRFTAFVASLFSFCVALKLVEFIRSLLTQSVSAPTITLTVTRNTSARMRTAPDSSPPTERSS